MTFFFFLTLACNWVWSVKCHLHVVCSLTCFSTSPLVPSLFSHHHLLPHPLKKKSYFLSLDFNSHSVCLRHSMCYKRLLSSLSRWTTEFCSRVQNPNWGPVNFIFSRTFGFLFVFYLFFFLNSFLLDLFNLAPVRLRIKLPKMEAAASVSRSWSQVSWKCFFLFVFFQQRGSTVSKGGGSLSESPGGGRW